MQTEKLGAEEAKVIEMESQVQETQPQPQQEPEMIDDVTRSKIEEMNNLFNEVTKKSSEISWMEYDVKQAKKDLEKLQQDAIDFRLKVNNGIKEKYGDVAGIAPNGMIVRNQQA